jgi:hypothetical protein
MKFIKIIDFKSVFLSFLQIEIHNDFLSWFFLQFLIVFIYN